MILHGSQGVIFRSLWGEAPRGTKTSRSVFLPVSILGIRALKGRQIFMRADDLSYKKYEQEFLL